METDNPPATGGVGDGGGGDGGGAPPPTAEAEGLLLFQQQQHHIINADSVLDLHQRHPQSPLHSHPNQPLLPVDEAVEAMDTHETDPLMTGACGDLINPLAMLTEKSTTAILNKWPPATQINLSDDTNMIIAPALPEDTTVAAADSSTTPLTSNMDASGTFFASAAAGIIDSQIEEEARAEATFSFRIDEFSKLKESVLSPACFIRSLPWKIMAMPRSDRYQPENRSLGFFLQCNGESESSAWSCQASAELRLRSFKEGQEPFMRRIKHLFHSKENDWGFSFFMAWNDILDPERGYYKDDSIILEVFVQADAPHGVYWDSKRHTGYVGLKNQGATCYMNSLLQTLYFTNQLRKAVYKMPTEADDSSKSVALALQRVFYDLQFTEKSVGTKKLTKSFGWETLDSFMQHDVQEFLRVLLDKMESKMKGTCVEGAVPKLFEGKMTSYIRCKNVDYTSSRMETFYDVQLNIKGKRDINESFKDYIEPETLDGDNKYDAGQHGLQKAEKGVKFVSFPPVLHLHLMRFHYDPISDSSVKFNDRFEFYEKINLDQYLDEKEATSADYRLHAVLVHSGDNHGGHYVVYINPTGDGKFWCKFDDDVVAACPKNEAIEQNYGGSDEENLNAKHCSNAYMLVYIRESELANVLEEIRKDDIPMELSERLAEEKRMDTVRRRERNDAGSYITVQVILEEYFDGCYQSHTHGLSSIGCGGTATTTTSTATNVAHGGGNPALAGGGTAADAERQSFRTFRMRRQQTVGELITILAETFKVKNYQRMRIWFMPEHQILRAKNFEFGKELETLLQNVKEMHNATIFLELAAADAEQLDSFNPVADILVFFKYYDPYQKRLNYYGCGIYSLQRKLLELQTELNLKMGFPAGTELQFYEDSNDLVKLTELEDSLEKLTRKDFGITGATTTTAFGMQAPQALVTNATAEDSHPQTYVLIFENKRFCEEKFLELPTCEDYKRDLQHRIDITFVDKSMTNDTGFTLHLSQKSSYDQMANAVGQKINCDPYEIQFYKCHGFRDTPSNPIQCPYDGIIKDILSTNNKKNKKLFYQRLSMSIRELENKKQFKCLWLSTNLKEEKELVLYPNKNGTVNDILLEATKQIDFSAESTRELRLIEIISHTISAELSRDASLENLQNDLSVTPPIAQQALASQTNPQKIYRIEEILPDELNLQDNESLIPVAHFSKDIYSTFGVPFLTKARNGEPYGALKQRIQKRLNVPDKEWEKYKFAIHSMGRLEHLPDDITPVNLAHFKANVQAGSTPFFGLDHINKSQKRSRYTHVEKAIKIYN